MFLISIVTVNYNNADGLHKTYRSLISQDDADFEWVVIDGESNDRSIEFIESVDEEFEGNRLVFFSGRDKGIYDAMNKGVTLASGLYILFLNSGDELYDKNTIRAVKKHIRDALDRKEHRLPIFYGDFIRVMPGGRYLYSRAKSEQYIYRGLPTSHQAIFYPREFLACHPYDLSYRISGDYYITCLAHVHGYPLRRMGMIISRFSTGGTASQNSRIVQADIMRTQREVLKMSRIMTWLYAARRQINIWTIRIIHKNKFGSALFLKLLNLYTQKKVDP